jgi:putative DNA primase/helicase
MQMDAKGITAALRGKWQGRYPAHADRTPSLKINHDPSKADGIDVHCFAGCDWRDVKATLIREGLLPEFESSSTLRLTLIAPKVTEAKLASFAEDTHKREHAHKIWRASTPLLDTLGYRYFTEHRSLDIKQLGDLGHCLRWHEGISAVIALMTDALSNEPCGIHRTYLDRDGTKCERKMLGKAGVVRLSRDEDVLEGLGICEGVEDALAILLTGWAPVWAATSAGAIERFPVLTGIENLTVFIDEDAPGIKAAESCAERWALADREARIAHPREFMS